MAESSNSSPSWLASGTTKVVLLIVGAGLLAIVLANRMSPPGGAEGGAVPAPKKSAPKDGRDRPPTVLASSKTPPVDIVLTLDCADGVGPMFGDAKSLYVNACGAVRRVDKKDGKSEVLLREGSVQLAMDDAHLYVPTGRAIRVLSKSDGKEALVIDPAPCRSDLVVDADSIYCIARGEQDGILRVPKKGGAQPSILRSAPPSSIAALTVDDDALYFAVTTPKPLALQIVRMPKSGAEEVVIAQRDADHSEVPIANPRSLTIMGDDAYWVSWCYGCPIASTNKRGGGETSSHTSVEKRTFEAFVAYDNELYATSGDGQLTRVASSTKKNQFPTALPLDTTGGPLQNRAPRALHVDETHVYWARPRDQQFVIERVNR